jgi:hypothetical protein
VLPALRYREELVFNSLLQYNKEHLVDHISSLQLVHNLRQIITLVSTIRLRKIIERRGATPTEGKEDLSTALDYLDEIQDDIKLDEEEQLLPNFLAL